jgi:hypothetical protein
MDRPRSPSARDRGHPVRAASGLLAGVEVDEAGEEEEGEEVEHPVLLAAAAGG